MLWKCGGNGRRGRTEKVTERQPGCDRREERGERRDQARLALIIRNTGRKAEDIISPLWWDHSYHLNDALVSALISSTGVLHSGWVIFFIWSEEFACVGIVLGVGIHYLYTIHYTK